MTEIKQTWDLRFIVAAALALGLLFVVPPAFRVSAVALAIVLVVLAPLPASTRPVVSAVILGLATGVGSINLFAPQIFQKLRVIASIEEPELIARILAHWERSMDMAEPEHLPMAARAPPRQGLLL